MVGHWDAFLSTDGRTDREIDGQTDRQTDRQKGLDDAYPMYYMHYKQVDRDIHMRCYFEKAAGKKKRIKAKLSQRDCGSGIRLEIQTLFWISIRRIIRKATWR